VKRTARSRCDGTVEAGPHDRRIAVERHFDGLAAQRQGLAVEQRFGGTVAFVAAAARPAGGVAGGAVRERPAARHAMRFLLFLLFYQRQISHRRAPRKENLNPNRSGESGFAELFSYHIHYHLLIP
jgi:hypothetical protein